VERIAQVLVNIPTRKINKLFSYAIPQQFDFVDKGWRVWVPFGGRRVEGFITAIAEGDTADLKPIFEVWDEAPWFDANMLATAQWISNYYLCSLGEALRLFIPGGSSVVSTVRYTLAEEAQKAPLVVTLTEENALLMEYIRKNEPVKHEVIVKKFGLNAGKSLQWLLRRNLITKQIGAKQRASFLFEVTYSLAVSPENAAAIVSEYVRKPAQRKVLELLLQKTFLTYADVKAHRISRSVLNQLIAVGLVSEEKKRMLRDSYAHVGSASNAVCLTEHQTAAVTEIISVIEMGQHRSFLLHGVTGSGKTEVYLAAVAAARQAGRQAMVLVPEIALTSQLVTRFKARFGDDVTVIHSKLSLSERQDAWKRLKGGETGIAIGVRSAVFAPLPAIGVIILDEEHEFSYKQEETPRYHTREVAVMRAKLAGAPVILGSATPAVESYYRALHGEFKLLTMPSRIGGALPDVTVVDMRDELKKGNRSVISPALQDLLISTIERGEQAIILLNRRGYATFVLCRECGHVMTCGHCSVALVYHAADKSLRCHYCQRSLKRLPDQCPSCQSRYIRYFGSGTQKVEEELTKIMPNARILRMDQDTTGRKFAHDRILADFSSGKYDILLGTQMVAKGHDISNVTAVGIISADTALNLPDFRAAERTFALLMQAAGRAGRGVLPGKVVVQTYNPDHYAVKAGANQDYRMFFEAEIGFRETLLYPPFTRITKVTLYGADETGIYRQAEKTVYNIRTELLKNGRDAEILGPFPAAVSRVDDIFRVNILIKHPNLAVVQTALRTLGMDAQPGIIVDIEPLNTM
jgi:primosomal protein N' (replication factor Y)